MRTDAASRMKIVTSLLACAAAGLSAVLLYQSLTHDALPGCGGGSGCGEVLSSRWSSFFGVPVSLFAVGIYLLMLLAVIARSPRAAEKPQHLETFVVALSALTAIAAAGWFIAVQALVIKALCKYCMATHALGVTASVLCLLMVYRSMRFKSVVSVMVCAAALVGVMIAGQVFGPKPKTAGPVVQYVDDLPTPTSSPGPADAVLTPDEPVDTPEPGKVPEPDKVAAETPDAPSETPKNPTAPVDTPQLDVSQTVPFYGGRLNIDPSELPIAGNLDAQVLMVCLFDYTCQHCRTTRKMLERTSRKHGDGLGILFLPAPLDGKCNRMIKRTQYQHRHACMLAKMSLAVWRADPKKWVAFDKALYTDTRFHTPGGARKTAVELIGEQALDSALEDPWADAQLARDVNTYQTTAKAAGKGALPMLITRRGVMSGTPDHPSEVDRFIKRSKPAEPNKP